MAQQDPTLMNATPSKKALLDSINTQVKAQTANQYGYSPYQAVGSLPAQEQDAILGDMANQITYKGGISVSKDDLKQLPVFRPPTFMDSLGNIGQNIGKGIIPERNAYPQEAPLDGWGTFGNAFTQSATGGIVDTKEGNNFWADFGGNLAGMGASIGAGAAIGAGVGSVVPVVGTAVGAGAGALIAGGLGAFGNTLRGYEDRGKPIDGTAFADATLQGGLAVVPVFGKAGQVIGKVAPKLTGKLASSALGRLANTGAGKLVGNTLLEGAENVVGEAGSQALRNEYDPRALALSGALGAGAGAGLHLSSKAIGKLAGKRAKITEAPSQKQAVQALQNEADNAPLPSQRNRARATLRRINTELPVQQPISTRKPFKTAIETPQAKPVAQKPVAVVPIKKKIKPPFQLPTKVVGGFKKKVVTPAKVAKPANVDVKRETTTAKKPWEMNKKEWDYERDKIRPETFGSASPKGAKSLAVSRIDRLEELNFGVYDNARNKLKQAQDLEIILTPDEVNNYLEEIQTHVTHKRVVEKALSEGKLVSEDVLKDYPDLQKKYAPTTKENLTVEPTSAKTAPVETTPAPKGKKGKLEPIKPNVVETRPKALKLNHDGVDFWVQKKWMRADGTLTASGVKSFEEARTKKQFFDSPEGKQAIENKQKRIDGAIQWALDKTIEDPSKNGVFKTSGASKIGETLAKLAESKGDFSFENMRKHHYLTGETATHTWELEHSKGYNPNASYDDVGSVTLRFKEKPPDTKVEPIPVKAKNHPPEVEGLKNGDKAPPMKEGESFDDYRARLEKQLPDGWGLRKASLDAGVVSLYEKTSKKRASAEGQADIEKVIGRPLDEASQDDLLKASKHFMEKATTDESPAITKANELIKKKANDAILEADARGEDTSVLRQAEANAIAGLDTLTEKGQIISVKDAPTEYELAIKRLKQDGNIDVAKVKAEADAVIKAIEDVEIPVKAINKGTRDIGTQLQDLKASQGTQVYTPDDIRRGVDVIGSHDSFLAQDTLEALGYPLKFSKNRKDPHSSGWSTVIGGKKIELYPGDSLGGLLRRNKISLNTLEKGLINKKYGDVVKRLVDDLDPNDLTLNETETRQKLTDYYDNLPKDGELLTSREAEAFSLLDNAKTPEELNAVERYVSENENDYQDGFHEEFYSQWIEKHKALEDGYKAGIENRVAKANETRQLKATEELKVLRKQLETETNKVLKLEKELALISPAVRLERKLQTDVLKDARKVAKRLKGGYESGKIDDAEFTRIVEGLSPEARNALAEEFSC